MFTYSNETDVSTYMNNASSLIFVHLQQGNTGLHEAARNGHYNVASALLNWGADANAVGVSQYVHVPVHITVMHKQHD